MAITVQQKEENMKTMTIYMSVVIGLIAAYFFGYTGSICNDYNISAIDGALKVVSELQEFHFLFTVNSSAIVGIIIGLVLMPIVYFFISNDNERHKAYAKDEVAGTGGFMSPREIKEYNEKYIEKEPDPSEDKPSPNMIMSDGFRRPINSRMIIGNNNVLVVGAAGTGKSRFFIKPNVLQMNASYVITDPSGEMIFSMGGTLQKHGYKIKIFNISDMAHSNCYNPLEYIRDDAGVSMLIECFIKNTTGKGSKGEEFFTNAEKLLYSACISYLIDFCKDESNKNFSSIMNLINASSIDENNPSAQSPLDIIFESIPKNSLAWRYYKAFKQAAGKTLKSIIISCVTRLRPFMTPQVVNLTKTDNMELEKIGKEKTALFIITPQADRTYSFLASMLYSQLFETLYYIGEQQKADGKSEQMDIPVRCMMDEFANIGEVPEFPSKLSTMRKYNISASVILQDLSQIESLYENDWRNLIGNCSTLIYLGATEQNTLKYFSDKLGEGTITSASRSISNGKKGSNRSYQQTSRKVMTEDELSRLPSNECIVYTQNMRPVRDLKYRLERHPRYGELADNEESSNAFMYKKIASFDNTKPLNINSLLKAKAEIALHQKNMDVTDPMKVDEAKLNLSKEDALDKIVLDENMEKKAFQYHLEHAIETAMNYYNDSVSIFSIPNVPPNRVPSLIQGVSDSIQKTPMIIFTDIESEDDLIFGFGIDNNNGNLMNAMNNKYIKSKLKLYNDSLIFVVIKRNVLDKYRRVVIEKYKTSDEEEIDEMTIKGKETDQEPEEYFQTVKSLEDEYEEIDETEEEYGQPISKEVIIE